MQIQDVTEKLTGAKPAITQVSDIGKPFSSNEFSDELSKASLSEDLNFSGHALKRLVKRGISLTGDQLNKLQNAVERAGIKGSKDSLVLLNDLAFVVSIKNRTVVTAIQTDKMKDMVFTNIDSTVIA